MNSIFKAIRCYARIAKNSFIARFPEEIDTPIVIPRTDLKHSKQYLDNIDAINRLSACNSINNLRTERAICSSKPGDHYTYLGYNVDKNNRLNPLFVKDNTNVGNYTSMACISTTVDRLYLHHFSNRVLLFHVDVEGMENDIFHGSDLMIKESKPYIIFESHISAEEHLYTIIETLHSYGIDAFFMINEVLPGARLDCRNFLAVHSSEPNKDRFRKLDFEKVCKKNRFLFRAFPTSLALLSI